MKPLHTALLLVALAAPLWASPPQSGKDAAIPYASLDEAMKAPRAKPGVEFRNEGGWIVAYDPETIVSWLLTPPGHPAYPSIVKRHIVNSASGADIATGIRCSLRRWYAASFLAEGNGAMRSNNSFERTREG